MYQWNTLSVETLEDGYKIEELSTDWSIPTTGGVSRAFFTSPRSTASILVLLGGADTNAVLSQVTALNGSAFATLRNSNSQQTDSILWAANQMPASTPPLPGILLSELPTQWIDYSAVDLMLVSIDELQRLSTSYPAQFQAVQRWARAGGNLIVYGVGDDWEKLSTLVQARRTAAGQASRAGAWP